VNESNQGQYATLLIFISFLLVLGSLLTAFAETGYPTHGLNDQNDSPVVTNYIFSTPTTYSTQTPTEYQTNPATPIPVETNAFTPTALDSQPILSQCDPPNGWVVYVIQFGETIESVAERFLTSEEALIEGNCLSTDSLLPGYIIFVPSNGPTP
jgi:LysM repeat protein